MGLLARVRRRLGLFVVVDGLADQKAAYAALFAASKVRVCSNAETEGAGWAGVVGEIYGETMPSHSRVDVIGTLQEDYAINVWSDEQDDQAWFAPHLLEVAE